jgi:hypothetical protein
LAVVCQYYSSIKAFCKRKTKRDSNDEGKIDVGDQGELDRRLSKEDSKTPNGVDVSHDSHVNVPAQDGDGEMNRSDLTV